MFLSICYIIIDSLLLITTYRCYKGVHLTFRVGTALPFIMGESIIKRGRIEMEAYLQLTFWKDDTIRGWWWRLMFYKKYEIHTESHEQPIVKKFKFQLCNETIGVPKWRTAMFRFEFLVKEEKSAEIHLRLHVPMEMSAPAELGDGCNISKMGTRVSTS